MTTEDQGIKNKLLELTSIAAKALIDTDEISYLIDIRSSMEFLFIGGTGNRSTLHTEWLALSGLPWEQC